MTPNEPSADSQHASPAIDEENTGLASLRTWNSLYIFVVAVFILWVVLLQLLTRIFS
jgi:hypothetical protein